MLEIRHIVDRQESTLDKLIVVGTFIVMVTVVTDPIGAWHEYRYWRKEKRNAESS
jgi:hypothetical protein